MASLFDGFIKRTPFELDYVYCWICIVYSWLHPPKTSQQLTLIDQFTALFTHYISCLRFRWIPVQETLAHSRMALMLLLQCYGVHMHSFTAWWTLWTDGMKWWRGKKKRHAWQCKLTHHSGACRHGRTVLLVPSIWRGDDPERTQISQNNSGADPARHTDAQRTSTGLQLNLLLSYLI